MELYQSVLIAIVAAIGQFTGDAFGGIMFNRPIVLAPIVGAILGDVSQGLMMGAALELIFLGVVSIGGSTPSDANMGSVLGTAFAMSMQQGVEIALALAVPIGLLMQMIKYLVYFFRATLMHKADEYAKQMDFHRITQLHFGLCAMYVIVYGCIAFVSCQFGAEPMKQLVDNIPPIIIEGLGVASNMLPAVGFALLINMLWNKQLSVFLLFGFVLATYLELPIVAIACIALTIGMVMIVQDMSNASKKRVVVETADPKQEEEAFFDE